jgi:hypothetical protein
MPAHKIHPDPHDALTESVTLKVSHKVKEKFSAFELATKDFLFEAFKAYGEGDYSNKYYLLFKEMLQ